MGTRNRYSIKQIAPQWPDTWAITEWFFWDTAASELLKRDIDGALFEAAYDAVDWESYYERLKGTPFYRWAVEGGGILSFGRYAHIEEGRFSSMIGDISTVEGDWLREHPEFNQVLHDIHAETAGQMIDYLLSRDQRTARPRKL
ncbi:MAG: hypothetical protein ACYTEQ_29625 [Planctomycetota bacterium]